MIKKVSPAIPRNAGEHQLQNKCPTSIISQRSPDASSVLLSKIALKIYFT